MAVMTRQALFGAAWARPLTQIAEELGITSTGLKKICGRACRAAGGPGSPGRVAER